MSDDLNTTTHVGEGTTTEHKMLSTVDREGGTLFLVLEEVDRNPDQVTLANLRWLTATVMLCPGLRPHVMT